jgi:formylmethanofuran dehydrogenase subunit E
MTELTPSLTDTEISEIMQFVAEQDHKQSFVRCDRCGALVPAHELCVNCDSYIFDSDD